MNAVRASTGKLIWQSGSLGPGFTVSGQFYSTPALAFGRVYAGNNDGRVYSYDQADGTLAWTHSTGGYVYSGPTVVSAPHIPPTVYVGSFDGNIYALNAKNGETRWSQYTGGQVIGSLSAVGNIVYVAEFTHTSTLGYDMRTGNRVFRYKTGSYTPVVSDGRRIYLTGYSSINALQPVRPKPKARSGRKPSSPRRRAPRAAAAAAEPAPGGGSGTG
jgi:outer membrane protein assembly factor BamB